MQRKEIINSIISSFQDNGLRAQIGTENDIISSAASGMNFGSIVSSDNISLTLISSFNTDYTDNTLEKCNEINSNFKFCRCYSDNNNQIFAQMDIFIPETNEQLIYFINQYIPIWETYLGIISNKFR